MLTQQELKFLYDLLDQMSTRGEESKAMVLELMRKLRQMQEAKSKETEE